MMDRPDFFARAIENEIKREIEAVIHDLDQSFAEELKTRLRKRAAEIVLSVLSGYDVRSDGNRLLISVKLPE